MLVFTHLDERPEWLDPNEPSPIEQVEEECPSEQPTAGAPSRFCPDLDG